MTANRPQRTYRQFTPEERERWQKAKDEVLAERPQMIEKLRRLKEASREPNFSGALRTAIHRHPKLLPLIAVESGIPLIQLDELLTGERTMRSDSLDRLVEVLGFKFPPEPPPKTWKTATESGATGAPIVDPANIASATDPTSTS